jgi:putative transposase
VPKYRFKILKGPVKIEVGACIREFTMHRKRIIEELNIQEDHVHLLVKVPPKLSISDYIETVKGRSAIRIFTRIFHE